MHVLPLIFIHTIIFVYPDHFQVFETDWQVKSETRNNYSVEFNAILHPQMMSLYHIWNMVIKVLDLKGASVCEKD